MAGVWMVAALAIIIAPAHHALGSSPVPPCFDSELATVSQAFDAVAPPGSAMRQDGDLKRAADTALPGVVVSRALIDIAARYGFVWSCTTQSFIPPAWATTSTSAATTTSTTTATTTSGTGTISPTKEAVLPSAVNSAPAPTPPAPATTSTTRTPRGSTGSAVAQGSAVVEGSPAPSTTQPAVPAGDVTIDVPAEEGGALAASLPLSPADPRRGGDGGRMVAVLIALVAVIGAGSGVLLRVGKPPRPRRAGAGRRQRGK